MEIIVGYLCLYLFFYLIFTLEDGDFFRKKRVKAFRKKCEKMKSYYEKSQGRNDQNNH